MTLELEQQSQLRQKHSTWIEISREALLHNLSQIRQSTQPGAEIFAVVKANAYGHGLTEVVRALDGRVAYFGVANVGEGLHLRRFEIDTPILLFGVPTQDEIASAIQAKITISVSSLEEAEMISAVACELQQPAVIHIKVDTGMGRLGILKMQAVQAIEAIAGLQMLNLEGIYTHFPQGDEESDMYTKEQIRFFQQIISRLAGKGIHFAYRHAANSAGIINHRESHLNLVRPGVTLYGVYPSAKMKRNLDLVPVLAFRTKVIMLKKISAGESVGYGRSFRAASSTTIGVLPVGYSSGYPFSLSSKSVVLLNGKPYPLIGRVSMDYITVDFGREASQIQVGDVVTLLGRDGEREITADFLAERAGTISYEIVTQLNPNIPRFVV